MYNSIDVVTVSLNRLLAQMIDLLPMLVIALVIWLIGDYLLGLAVGLLRKVQIKNTKLDDKIVAPLSNMILWVGKALLVLLVLDYLGIGRTLIGAIANGLTFSVAIAFGLAFGKALEGDARNLVDSIRKLLVSK